MVNLTTLPVVSPSGSAILKVDLTSAETDADRISVIAKDVVGDEWSDINIFFNTLKGTEITQIKDMVESDEAFDAFLNKTSYLKRNTAIKLIPDKNTITLVTDNTSLQEGELP